MNRKRIGKTIGRIILLVLLLAAAAVPAVYMNTVYGYFAILFLVFLILFSGISLLILKRGIQAESSQTQQDCLRGGQVDIGLQLVNHSRLICPAGEASLMISDLFGGTDVRQNVPFTLPGKERVDLGFGMDMNHVGVYEVGLDQIEIRDFFGIFHSVSPVHGVFQVAVLPRTYTMEELDAAEAMAEANQETKVTTPGGMDYTGVREYVPGDPMKQIHWKLSAHSREYLTRLQEVNRQQEYAVVLDFAADAMPDREVAMDLNDTLIETALSIGEHLNRLDSLNQLFYTNRSGQITKTANMRFSEYGELLRDFAQIHPDAPADFPDAAAVLDTPALAHGRGNVLVVTSRITEGLLDALRQIRSGQRAVELFVVVPAEWNSRQLEALHARLECLEEARIVCHLVSTAVRQVQS